jgi:hypothetical protein
MIEEPGFITDEDRVALLGEGIAILGTECGGRYRGVVVSAPDAMRARERVCAQLGATMDVWVCGEAPREVKPRPCVGYLEREPRRLQVRFVLQGDQHIDDIVVAEDESAVVVLGTVCVSVHRDEGPEVECPAHVWLRQPLGDRSVIDGFNGQPVPYKNVWTHIERRLAEKAHEHTADA